MNYIKNQIFGNGETLRDYITGLVSNGKITPDLYADIFDKLDDSKCYELDYMLDHTIELKEDDE